MNDLTTQLITVFLGFFAIMNPIANTAAFAGLAGDLEPAAQRRVAAKALILTFGIILAFAILGKTIFYLFGITLPALRITGGILVFLVGYHMLTGSGSHLHSSEAEPASDIAVSPLAVPLLAGPRDDRHGHQLFGVGRGDGGREDGGGFRAAVRNHLRVLRLQCVDLAGDRARGPGHRDATHGLDPGGDRNPDGGGGTDRGVRSPAAARGGAGRLSRIAGRDLRGLPRGRALSRPH